MLFGLCLAGCLVEILLSQFVHKLDKVITPTVTVIVFAEVAILGQVNFSRIGDAPMFATPVPVKFGLDFDWFPFIPVAFIYLVTAIETSVDLTANSVISGEPVEGELYKKRI